MFKFWLPRIRRYHKKKDKSLLILISLIRHGETWKKTGVMNTIDCHFFFTCRFFVMNEVNYIVNDNTSFCQ